MSIAGKFQGASATVSISIPGKDWNEHDHPRDPNTGEFIELGQGMFLFGKSKTAKYSSSKGEATVDLKPGDTAYKTDVGNVLIQHVDGSMDLYDPSQGKGKSVKVPAQSALSEKVAAGSLEKIGENPATQVQAGSEQEAADKIKNPGKWKSEGQDPTPAPGGEASVGGASVVLEPGDHAWTKTLSEKEQQEQEFQVVGIIERADGSLEYYTDGEPYDGMDPDALKQWWDAGGKEEIAQAYTDVTPGAPEEEPDSEDVSLDPELPEPEPKAPEGEDADQILQDQAANADLMSALSKTALGAGLSFVDDDGSERLFMRKAMFTWEDVDTGETFTLSYVKEALKGKKFEQVDDPMAGQESPAEASAPSPDPTVEATEDDLTSVDEGAKVLVGGEVYEKVSPFSWKTPQGQVTSTIALGDKVKAAKKSSKQAEKPQDAPKTTEPLQAPPEPPAPTSGPSAAPVSGSVLKHPATGEEIQVPAGKKVWKHNKFESYIFASGPDDESPTFVQQTGKWKYKSGKPLTPPKDTFALLETNYKVVETPAPAAPEKQTSVEEVQALLQPVGTPDPVPEPKAGAVDALKAKTKPEPKPAVDTLKQKAQAQAAAAAAKAKALQEAQIAKAAQKQADDTAMVDTLKVGDQVHVSTSHKELNEGTYAVWTVQEDGSLKSSGPALTPEGFVGFLGKNFIAVKVEPAQPEVDDTKAPDATLTAEQYDAFPVGQKIEMTLQVKETTSPTTTWVKGEDGLWKQDVDNAAYKGYSGEQMSKSFMNGADLTVTQKVLDAPAAPETDAPGTQDAPMPGIIDVSGDVDAVKHPVSGALLQVPVGKKVFQHKKSKDSYIVATGADDTSAQMFDKNGKIKNPPSHVFAKLDENWDVIYEAKHIVAEPTVQAPEPEPEPEPVKPKKKAPSKSPKAKTAAPLKQHSPDQQYTLPGGTVVDLNPGDKVYHLPEIVNPPDHWNPGGVQMSERYAHVRNGFVYEAWDVSGQNTYWYGSESMVKDLLEKSKGSVVAEREGPYKVEDFQVSPPKEQTEKAALKTLKAALSSFAQAQGMTPTSSGGQYLVGKQEVFYLNGEPVTWDDATHSQRVDLLASLEEAAVAAQAALTPVSKWSTDVIAKSEKSYIGKARNRFERIARFARFAQTVQGWPDNGVSKDDLQEEYAALYELAQKGGATWGSAKEFPFRPQLFINSLKSVVQEKSFLQGIEDLGFDPLSATPAQYTKYAQGKGFDLMAALTPEQQKNWVLADLSYPNLSLADKQSLDLAVKHATEAVALAQLKAATKSFLPAAQQAVPAYKQEAVIPLIAEMQSTYSWNDGDGERTLQFAGPDEWSYSYQPQSGQAVSMTLTDAAAGTVLRDVAATGVLPTGSGSLAYAPVATPERLQAFLGDVPIADGAAVAQRLVLAGVPSATAGAMLPSQMDEWIRAHLTGDYMAKFSIESEATPDAPHLVDHLGNPNTHHGARVIESLAVNLAAKKETWADTLLNGTPGDLGEPEIMKAFDSLGLVVSYQTFWGNSANEIPIALVAEAVNTWHEQHIFDNKTAIQDALKKYSTNVVTNSVEETYTPPANVSDEAWALVQGVKNGPDLSKLVGEALSEATEASLDSLIQQHWGLKSKGVTTANLPGVPTAVKRLMLWASSSSASGGDPDLRTDIVHVAADAIKKGYWLTDKTPVWIAPDGSKFPIAPGSTVWKNASDKYFVQPPEPSLPIVTWFNGAVETAGSQYHKTWFAPGNSYALDKVFTMPGAVTWDSATGENPEFSKAVWDDILEVEAKAVAPGADPSLTKVTLSGPDLTYEIKHALLTDEFKSAYPTLSKQIHSYPEKLQQYIYDQGVNFPAPGTSAEARFSVMEYRASKGVYATMLASPLFTADSPINVHLGKAQVGVEGVKQWSAEALDEYMSLFPQLGSTADIPAHLDLLLGRETSPQAAEGAIPAVLQLSKVNKQLGGMHSKSVWIDQNTNEWMSKAFNNDPNGPARVDAEHIANVIGREFGFGQPETRVMTLNGQYSYLQHLAPATGSLLGKAPKDLTLDQVKQAMEEHVLDWLVSNHDSHQENLLVAPDGTVFGIDKGQAFKFFPNDKLAVGYLPPGNGAPVWYDRFYAEVKAGNYTKAEVDEVATAVLRKALRSSKRDDQAYRDLLVQAFDKRANFPDGLTKAQFIDKIVERKNNAFDDFVDFYKGLYASSPYEFDIDLEALQKSKLDDHTHIAITQDLADDVMKAKAYGKALFFDSQDVEDGHAIIAVHKKGGKDSLHGEMKLRKDADAILVDWISQQQVSGGAAPQSSTPSNLPDPALLPGVDDWYAKVLAGAKTVNHHSSDGQYNEGTLAQMDLAKSAMQSLLLAIDKFEADNAPSDLLDVTFPSSTGLGKVKMLSHEQQDAWRAAITQLIGDIDNVTAAKDGQIKVFPHVVAPTYKPSANLDTSGTPKVTGQWQHSDGSGVWKKYNSGLWTFTQGDTETKSTQAEFTASGSQDRPLPLDDIETAPDGTQEEQEDVTVTSTVGATLVSVTKRKFQAPQGTLDPVTGELKVTGEGNGGHGGFMYEIQFEGTTVTYMPWGTDASNYSNDGVPRAQQGLLKFSHDDWDGSSSDIEKVFSVLSSMGLDFDPGTEEGLELYYWRHMYGIIQDRADGSTTYDETIKAIQAKFAAKPEMNPTEELKVLREAWALSIGKDKVDKAPWRPQFARLNQALSADDDQFTSGKPRWVHPQFSYAALHKVYGDTVAASSLSNNSLATNIAMSGAALSTEERLRVLGQWLGGMSSEADQGHGSSSFIFTRQNFVTSARQVYYHPRVSGLTHNYSYNTDHYGEVDYKKTQAYFDIPKSADRHSSDNELLIKNSLSMMDDIIALVMPSAAERDKVIKHYESMGVKTLHGLPLNEIFVLNYTAADQTAKKVWAALLKAEKEGTAA